MSAQPSLLDRPRKTLEQCFWSKVDKRGDDECWPWTGSHGPHGHGALRIGPEKKHTRATAVAWFFAYGEWPQAGLDICHRCDNPPCVNPAHLFLGTAVDNMRDCIAKGRFKFLKPRCGELNNKTKLTPRQVLDARAKRACGMSVSAIARECGVARSTIREAMNGFTWKHISEYKFVPEGQ